jgi:hypothetical protein
MLDDPSGAGVAPFPLPSPGLVLPIRPGFVVAIPVRDEEQRLPACLRALAQQRDQLGACPSSRGIFGTNLIPFAT